MPRQHIFGPNKKKSVKRLPANVWAYPLPVRGPKPKPVVMDLEEVRRRLRERNGCSPGNSHAS